MIENEPGADWRDLQRRVAAILHECGFASETGKKLATARGTVEIDVYATDPTTTPPGNYLCECKRWKTHVPQAEVQTFRTIMADAGAISVSSFQQEAFRRARSTSSSTLIFISSIGQGFRNYFLSGGAQSTGFQPCVNAEISWRGMWNLRAAML